MIKFQRYNKYLELYNEASEISELEGEKMCVRKMADDADDVVAAAQY